MEFTLTLIHFNSYHLKLQEIVSWLVSLHRLSDFQEWVTDVETGAHIITLGINVKWKYLTGLRIRRVDIYFMTLGKSTALS